VPIIIQYFQRDNLKKVTDFLSKEVKDVFELKIKNLQESNKVQFDILSSKIDNELSIIREKYSAQSNEIEASLFYLQGKQSFSSSRFNVALKDYIKSAEFWAKSSRPDRVDVLLTNIRLCVNNLKTYSVFEKALAEFKIDWETFLNTMEKEQNFTKEKIDSIRIAVSRLTK